jgi:anti-sigma regulatory factor (Ser/Thr protein kinase)
MPGEFDRQYPANRAAPQAARSDVAEFLAGEGHAKIIGDAMLLVSELVTNSYLHARGPITVHARCVAQTLHVEVDDRDGALEGDPPRNDNGRGLRIVEAVASNWGTREQEGPHRSTWFELELH